MLHSNIGEVHQLLSTFNRVWGAGGEASLSLKTVDGKVSAVLEVQLGPPTFPRPGAPEACQQAAGSTSQQPGQRRRRHRGPGRKARDAAQQEAWRKRRLESQPPRHSPPCEQCAFSSDTQRGLSVHKGKAHIKCEYLTDECDGTDFCYDCTDERFYRENPELDIPFSHNYP